MTTVHPHAHVSAGARLANGVRIGPGAVVEDDVEIGADSELLPGCVLHAGSRIGARCRLGPHAVIGGAPMDRSFRGEPSLAIVEDGVVVREFATVHRATGEGRATRVGAGTLIMCYVHLGHNATVGAGCVLTNGVQLGGHVEVGERAVLGGGAMVHQFARVGAYAMVGGGSGVGKDILPYALAEGSPVRHLRANRVGLERAGFDGDARKRIGDALRHLRRKETDAFALLAAAHGDVAAMQAFIQSSQRGVARFAGA